ncbi:MAG TPA: hypothetical protein ENI60_01535, partial [Candidatus Fraserbacteria bacterium]|nr:hypothetical protein [Candidatus Fraserbacteria bacterium]
MKLFIGLSSLARSYPRTTLALIAGLTLFFIGGLTQLRIANDPQEFLPTAPVVQSFRQVERDFGSASFTHKLFVRFAPRPGYSVKSPQAVLEQERVLEALRAVPGIVSATGLPDWVKELRRQMHGGDSAYAQLVPYDKQLGYSLAELIKLTFQRLAFAKQYVSDQGTAMVVAQISPQADLAQVAHLAQAALLPLQRQEQATKSGLMSYGSALEIFNRTTRRDLRLFAPLTIGLVVLLLLWLFRHLRPADWRTLLPGAAGLALIAIGPALPLGGLPDWAPWLAGSTLILISLLWSLRHLLNLYLVLIVVGLAGVWKLGLLGLLGLPLNFLLVSTIPLIIGVGIDYPIHLLHRYEEERHGMTGPAAMGKTLEHSTRMLLANTLTTVAGFSSLLLTQSLPIQTFGLLFSFAMIANFLLTLTLLPAIKQLQSEGRS